MGRKGGRRPRGGAAARAGDDSPADSVAGANDSGGGGGTHDWAATTPAHLTSWATDDTEAAVPWYAGNSLSVAQPPRRVWALLPAVLALAVFAQSVWAPPTTIDFDAWRGATRTSPDAPLPASLAAASPQQRDQALLDMQEHTALGLAALNDWRGRPFGAPHSDRVFRPLAMLTLRVAPGAASNGLVQGQRLTRVSGATFEDLDNAVAQAEAEAVASDGGSDAEATTADGNDAGTLGAAKAEAAHARRQWTLARVVGLLLHAAGAVAVYTASFAVLSVGASASEARALQLSETRLGRPLRAGAEVQACEFRPEVIRWASVAAGCLFAVHPMTVHAVMSLDGRGDVLGLVFAMLALTSFARGVDENLQRVYEDVVSVEAGVAVDAPAATAAGGATYGRGSGSAAAATAAAQRRRNRRGAGAHSTWWSSFTSRLAVLRSRAADTVMLLAGSVGGTEDSRFMALFYAAACADGAAAVYISVACVSLVACYAAALWRATVVAGTGNKCRAILYVALGRSLGVALLLLSYAVMRLAAFTHGAVAARLDQGQNVGDMGFVDMVSVQRRRVDRAHNPLVTLPPTPRLLSTAVHLSQRVALLLSPVVNSAGSVAPSVVHSYNCADVVTSATDMRFLVALAVALAVVAGAVVSIARGDAATAAAVCLFVSSLLVHSGMAVETTELFSERMMYCVVAAWCIALAGVVANVGRPPALKMVLGATGGADDAATAKEHGGGGGGGATGAADHGASDGGAESAAAAPATGPVDPTAAATFTLASPDAARSPRWLLAIAVAVVAACAATTSARLGSVYRDEQAQLHAAVAACPSALLAHERLGDQLLDAGDVEGATAAYTRVAAVDPGYCPLQYRWAALHLRSSRDPHKVMKHLTAALSCTSHPEIKERAFRALSVLWEADPAVTDEVATTLLRRRAEAFEAMERADDAATCWREVGVWALTAKNWTDARASLGRALAVSPSRCDVMYWLGKVGTTERPDDEAMLDAGIAGLWRSLRCALRVSEHTARGVALADTPVGRVSAIASRHSEKDTGSGDDSGGAAGADVLRVAGSRSVYNPVDAGGAALTSVALDAGGVQGGPGLLGASNAAASASASLALSAAVASTDEIVGHYVMRLNRTTEPAEQARLHALMGDAIIMLRAASLKHGTADSEVFKRLPQGAMDLEATAVQQWQAAGRLYLVEGDAVAAARALGKVAALPQGAWGCETHFYYARAILSYLEDVESELQRLSRIQHRGGVGSGNGAVAIDPATGRLAPPGSAASGGGGGGDEDMSSSEVLKLTVLAQEALKPSSSEAGGDLRLATAVAQLRLGAQCPATAVQSAQALSVLNAVA